MRHGGGGESFDDLGGGFKARSWKLDVGRWKLEVEQIPKINGRARVNERDKFLIEFVIVMLHRFMQSLYHFRAEAVCLAVAFKFIETMRLKS